MWAREATFTKLRAIGRRTLSVLLASTRASMVKKFVLLAALPVAMLFAFATGTTTALADEPILMKAPVASLPAPGPCDSVPAFFLSSCQLAWYGVKVYGTIDVGGGYQTNGAPFNSQFPQGSSYVVQKMNRESMWTLAPSALSRSNIGVQVNEPFAPGWAFVGQLEASFDPYSLQFSNGPASIAGNRGVPLDEQSANNDFESRWPNLQFVGLRRRQLRRARHADLFPAKCAHTRRRSCLRSDGGLLCLLGAWFFELQLRRRRHGNLPHNHGHQIQDSHRRIPTGALAQVGGYAENNGSNGDYEGQIGGDIPIGNFGWGQGLLSLDTIYKWEKDAVNLSLSGAPTAAGVPIAPFLPQTLTATISNNQSVMLLSKYTVGSLRLFAGYEWYQLAPPSDPVNTVMGFSNIGGLPMGTAYANMTAISNTAFSAGCGTGTGCSDKTLQVMWTGARYAVSRDIDVAAAYYHYIQSQYVSGAGICANPTAHSQCAGTFDAVSALLDWRFLPKWDAYFGMMFSQVNAGLSNGYLARNNFDPTVGVRFRF